MSVGNSSTVVLLFVIIFFIALIPRQKAVSWELVTSGILGSLWLIIKYPTPSSIVPLRDPDLVRLAIAALFSARLVKFCRSELNSRAVDVMCLAMAATAFLYMLQMRDGMLMTRDAGPHWLIASRALFEPTLNLGPNVLLDAAWYQNQASLPYGLGASFVPLIFGEGLKLSIPVLIVGSLYLLARLGKLVAVSNGRQAQGKIEVPILIVALSAPVYFVALVTSGAYYPYPILGASFIMTLALLFFVDAASSKRIKTFYAACVAIFGASLFRTEVLLILPVVFLLFVRHESRAKIARWMTGTFAIGFAAFISQAWIKYDDPFQSGIGWNVGIQDPTFKAFSLEYLRFNLTNFFLRVPGVRSDFPWFLNYRFTWPVGSEPGGYLTFKYPWLLILGGVVLASLGSIIKKLSLRTTQSNESASRHFSHLVPGLAATVLIAFYLCSFTSSPKYEMLFVPLAASSFVLLLNKFRKVILLFAVWSLIVCALSFETLISAWPHHR